MRWPPPSGRTTTAVQDPDTDEERTARRTAREDARTPGPATASALDVARARQRDEFGGVNWGASFFGWLVAVGVAALLTALLAAAGAAIGLTVDETTSRPAPRRSASAAASRCSPC